MGLFPLHPTRGVWPQCLPILRQISMKEEGRTSEKEISAQGAS